VFHVPAFHVPVFHVPAFRLLVPTSDFSEETTVKKGVELLQDLVATETFKGPITWRVFCPG
jgi:hypothetical protein